MVLGEEFERGADGEEDRALEVKHRDPVGEGAPEAPILPAGLCEASAVEHIAIVEGGACNIFMTYENEIYTPSLEENILPGVTREFFISSLQKKDINVKQVDCPVSFLDSVSTIWFTSSTRGVQPIKSILNHGYEMDPDDALFRNAKEAFTNSIKDYFQDH